MEILAKLELPKRAPISRGIPLNSDMLLQKLIDLERSIGVETNGALRGKVLDAQECLLRMQGERVQHLRTQVAHNDSHRFALLRTFSSRKGAAMDS